MSDKCRPIPSGLDPYGREVKQGSPAPPANTREREPPDYAAPRLRVLRDLGAADTAGLTRYCLAGWLP